jgi:hypothetical protein
LYLQKAVGLTWGWRCLGSLMAQAGTEAGWLAAAAAAMWLGWSGWSNRVEPNSKSLVQIVCCCELSNDKQFFVDWRLAGRQAFSHGRQQAVGVPCCKIAQSAVVTTHEALAVVAKRHAQQCSMLQPGHVCSPTQQLDHAHACSCCMQLLLLLLL